MEGFGTLQYWAKLVDFLLFAGALIWIWQKFAKPQLEAAANAENARIAGIEEALAKAKADLAAARAEREAAEGERESILQHADASGARDLESALADAKAQAERVRGNAEGEVERQRYAAGVRLRIDMIEDALAKARRDAAARSDEALQSTLVDQLLDELTRNRKAGA
ncbi:hypothetical protein EPN52_02925 [bacterium]|nr:MAG: hypothetical protein EPN52_02925 [bacterium]